MMRTSHRDSIDGLVTSPSEQERHSYAHTRPNGTCRCRARCPRFPFVRQIGPPFAATPSASFFDQALAAVVDVALSYLLVRFSLLRIGRRLDLGWPPIDGWDGEASVSAKDPVTPSPNDSARRSCHPVHYDRYHLGRRSVAYARVFAYSTWWAAARTGVTGRGRHLRGNLAPPSAPLPICRIGADETLTAPFLDVANHVECEPGGRSSFWRCTSSASQSHGDAHVVARNVHTRGQRSGRFGLRLAVLATRNFCRHDCAYSSRFGTQGRATDTPAVSADI